MLCVFEAPEILRRERLHADDAAALAHIRLLRQMHGECFRDRAADRAPSSSRGCRRVVALVLGERPVHAELVLEVIERAEGLVDAVALIAADAARGLRWWRR